MNDKQLATLIMSNVAPLMVGQAGMAGVGIVANFQPTQQGANTAPFVYFVKIGDRRHGSPSRLATPNLDGTMTNTEGQVYETTFQFSAFGPQDPRQPTALTVSDMLNIVSGIMQSDTIQRAFMLAGVGILRITDVRNPFVVDDHDQFAANPSFDVVLTHHRTFVTTTPAVVAYEAKIRRV